MNAPRVRPGADDKAARIRLFLMDVDGVLTDGGIVYDANGLESKRFHVRDGHGIKMLDRAGVRVGIITGRTSEVVEVRARELGIHILRQGAHDKAAALREVLREQDVPVLRMVGFSAAPCDAEQYVLDTVDFVSSRPGGMGAVRQIIEFLLKANGSWRSVTAKYFEGKP